MDIKCEKFFENYLESISDKQLISYYEDVEWTPFPVLVMIEYQRRFNPKNEKDVQNKLKMLQRIEKIKLKELERFRAWSAEEKKKLKSGAKLAKKMSLDLSKLASKKGTEVSKIIKTKTERGLHDGIKTAKKITPSKMSNLELIEMLGQLRKSGLITSKEFNQKKKKLLAKI